MPESVGPRPVGLTVFFPAYNDSGTIASMVIRAVTVAAELTSDYEVIVVNDAELSALWAQMTPAADLVNGYKISRSDPFHRVVIGRVYHHLVSMLFGLKVRDVDCDFRLMRRSIFDRIHLEKTSGVICLEMMKKIHDAGFRIVEVPVHHYHRTFGRSQFFNFRRISRTAVDVMWLWVALVVLRRHRREPSSLSARSQDATDPTSPPP
jgi:hypothetical protein